MLCPAAAKQLSGRQGVNLRAAAGRQAGRSLMLFATRNRPEPAADASLYLEWFGQERQQGPSQQTLYAFSTALH